MQRMATAVAASARRDALIAIVGSTGTGKSQLAVDLALQFNGEIINSDAIQIYQGLPIITNKISIAEQKGVPHHLLSCVSLDKQPWTVGTFVNRAMDTINDIRKRGKVPILVGGTHYYVQSLLFRDTLAVAEDNLKDTPSNNERLSKKDSSVSSPILDRSTEEILAKLQEVDPVIANKWHPNDRRKIQRSLEIWLKTGKRASDLYAEQSQRTNGMKGQSMPKSEASENISTETHNLSSFALRYPTLLLWTHTDVDILRKRLDARLNKMVINDGLIKEATELYQFQRVRKESDRAFDDTRGIFVAVGYKEFLDYLVAKHEGLSSITKLEELKNEGFELTRIATRQYAKRQHRWIRIKLVNALRNANAANNLVVLDTSESDDWIEKIQKPAVTYTKLFLEQGVLPCENNLNLAGITNDDSDTHTEQQSKWVKQTCEICNVTAVTPNDWQRHIQSSRHRKLKKKQDNRGTTFCDRNMTNTYQPDENKQ